MHFWIKIFFVLGFMGLFHKANAQLDTLNYLKQFELNEEKYIGEPFSTLLEDMDVVKPKLLFTQRQNCSYETQFWFIEEKPFSGRYKMTIVWQNAPFYKSEVMESKSSYLNAAIEYKNYVIKKLSVGFNDDFYILHLTSKSINKDTDSYNRIDSYLKTNKKNILNNSFFNFVCWLRPMNLTRIKNIYDKSKTVAPQTGFIVVNPYNKRKKAKIIVDWDSPISKNKILKYKKKKRNRFDNNKRSFYVEKIVKDMKVFRLQ